MTITKSIYSHYFDFILKYDAYVICPLLSIDRFINYCKARSISISREYLEKCEELELFYPIMRIRKPKIKIDKHSNIINDSSNDHEVVRIKYSFLDFEKNCVDSWFKEGLLWNPCSKLFQPWISFYDKELDDWEIESYYSIFQIYSLHWLLAFTRINTNAISIYDHSNEQLQEFSKSIQDRAKEEVSFFKKNGIVTDKIALICQSISNRYYTHAEDDMRDFIRALDFSNNRNAKERKAQKEWNAESMRIELGITPEVLKDKIESIQVHAHSVDPLAYWYDLVQFISSSERNKLKDKALLAQTLYSMEKMLRMFYFEITREELHSPDDAHDRLKESLLGFNPEDNPLLHLEFIVNSYGINPKPKLLLLVEGDGEELLFPDIAAKIFNMPFERASIDIINRKGTGNFRYLRDLIDFYHRQQTVVFMVCDSENKIPKLKLNLSNNPSLFIPQKAIIKSDNFHIWEKNCEFDNFTDSELAKKMTEIADNKYQFQSDEIESCRSSFHKKRKDLLGELYKTKTGHGMSHIKLLVNLGKIITDNPGKGVFIDDKKHKRPIIDLVEKIITIAWRNYQPTNKRTQMKNQESDFLRDRLPGKSEVNEDQK